MKLAKLPRKTEIRNEIPAELTDDMSISAEAKLLWIKLYNSNRGKGEYIKWTPSTQSLATMFGVKKLSVKRWLKELKDSGWVSVIGNRNDTTLIIKYNTDLVSNIIPALVSKKIPITNKDALRSEAMRKCVHNNTNNHSDFEEDFDRFFDND